MNRPKASGFMFKDNAKIACKHQNVYLKEHGTNVIPSGKGRRVTQGKEAG